MIIDRLDRFETYFRSGASIAKISRFLNAMNPRMADQEYEIDGQDIFARVMSYDTVASAEAKLETHRSYVDIQTTLVGVEVIDWIPRENLRSLTPYDQGNDAEFFEKPDQPFCRIRNLPGVFSLFFPEDAHMPKLIDGDRSEHVKKAVVKVRPSLLRALLK